MNILLPILVLTVPVSVIVLIAVFSGRRLAGSCGALSPDGKCARCGAPGGDEAKLRAPADGRGCP